MEGLEKFFSEVCITILGGKKVDRKTHILLYNELFAISSNGNQKNIKKKGVNILEEFKSVYTGVLRRFMHQRHSELLVKMCNEDMLKFWEYVQQLNQYFYKLLEPRKWLSGNNPSLLIMSYIIYKEILYANEIEKIDTLLEIRKQVSDCIERFHKEEREKEKKYAQNAMSLQKPFPRHRFTRTKNILKNIQFDYKSFMKNNQNQLKQITKTYLPLNKTAFILENVLSVEECKILIEKSQETGYTSLETEFVKQARDSDRSLIISPELSAILWDRIEPFLKTDEKVMSLTPFGFDSSGKWKPTQLNTCFRFCVYRGPSVGFAPHRDANFVPDLENRSALTCMFYLNNEFQGGSTHFIQTLGGGKMDETAEEELKREGSKKIIYELKPKPGLVLIFDHLLLHEGAPVSKGDKYIARTDVVYSRYEKLTQDKSYYHDPIYFKMRCYYKKAAEEECLGNVQLASELYERALSIRQHYRHHTSCYLINGGD